MVGDVATYSVRIRGCLAENWPAPPQIVAMTEETDVVGGPLTTMTLMVTSQRELMDILNQLNNLGFCLLYLREQQMTYQATAAHQVEMFT